MKRKITRSGFTARGKYPAPWWAREAAGDYVTHIATAYPDDNIRALLRPVTYCGPGSAGDKGAYVLDVSYGRHHELKDFYPPMCMCESCMCDHEDACTRKVSGHVVMKYVVDTCDQCAANMGATGGQSYIDLR